MTHHDRDAYLTEESMSSLQFEKRKGKLKIKEKTHVGHGCWKEKSGKRQFKCSNRRVKIDGGCESILEARYLFIMQREGEGAREIRCKMAQMPWQMQRGEKVRKEREREGGQHQQGARTEGKEKNRRKKKKVYVGGPIAYLNVLLLLI